MALHSSAGESPKKAAKKFMTLSERTQMEMEVAKAARAAAMPKPLSEREEHEIRDLCPPHALCAPQIVNMDNCGWCSMGADGVRIKPLLSVRLGSVEELDADGSGALDSCATLPQPSIDCADSLVKPPGGLRVYT
jgi:hypothetical protein